LLLADQLGVLSANLALFFIAASFGDTATPYIAPAIILKKFNESTHLSSVALILPELRVNYRYIKSLLALILVHCQLYTQ
jgi:hypothetical protein